MGNTGDKRLKRRELPGLQEILLKFLAVGDVLHDCGKIGEVSLLVINGTQDHVGNIRSAGFFDCEAWVEYPAACSVVKNLPASIQFTAWIR